MAKGKQIPRSFKHVEPVSYVPIAQTSQAVMPDTTALPIPPAGALDEMPIKPEDKIRILAHDLETIQRVSDALSAMASEYAEKAATSRTGMEIRWCLVQERLCNKRADIVLSFMEL